LLKILLAGKFLTLITLGASFGLYSWRYGPLVAGGLVGMIFVHEMGHVLEIRRQGMKATAPIFIPFFGAAIFQNSHPTDALRQAQIGIAGPVAGTLGATAALVMFHATGYSWLAVWAGIGFGLNLFNMIPVGMLDGGWILAPVSKWSQVLGLVLLVGASLWIHFPIEYLLLILVIGFPALMSRFQNAGSDYYRSVPMGGRIAMAIAWIGLCAYLIWGVFYVLSIFGVSPF
jgi:Zn-dependent protease